MEEFEKTNSVGNQFLEKAREIAKVPYLQSFLELVPQAALITTLDGAIILANSKVFHFLRQKPNAHILGLHLHQLLSESLPQANHELNCQQSQCFYCQIQKALEEVSQGIVSQKMAVLNFGLMGEEKTLRLRLSPCCVENQNFCFCQIEDVSREVQFYQLERTFLHDLQNTCGSLEGISEWLLGADVQEQKEIANYLQHISRELIEEIQSQSELHIAEQHQKPLNTTLVNSKDFLELTLQTFQTHPVAANKFLVISPNSEIFNFCTDVPLLKRLVNNLIKNALEVEDSGETITIDMKAHPKERILTLSVHNRSAIKAEVRKKILKEQVSTKSQNHSHGIGLMSIKLLSERYLHGKVCFTTSEGEGTTFTVTLPLSR